MNPTYEELRLLARQSATVELDAGQLEEMLDEIERLRALANLKPAKRNEYPPEFEEVWAAYPVERQGTKRSAFKAWGANIKRGVEPAEILLGLRRYLAHAEAIGTETKYLKLAATFFGPDEHFAANYVMPSAKQAHLGKAGQATARAAQDWMDGK
ncbi:hypothetical protein [Massilia antarctica]|uniref:hypothetical protein n=1 Tax=Massilia antarctica TaxID=2765360 RepID=UPI00226FC9B9|nr:hypothetical protein [Massilia sp. H27-R4]MCY0910864.1 hypothetical protein [Massilia sp. H27-R4]